MPAIAPNSLVLVSGASGFLAAHVCQQLLARGHRCRGTVRSEAKGQYLVDLLGAGFEYVLVEDIETPDAFDAAVVGVDAIIHTASPFHFRMVDPYADLINPAVNGTLNIMKSALQQPKRIRRIVITSSFAAMVNPLPVPYAFTEKDWNSYSVELVKEKGKDTDPFHAYRASKSLAEQAAWKFIDDNSVDGVAPFELSTVLPPLIHGPIIHECHSAAALNTSVEAWYRFLDGSKSDADAMTPNGSFVDVRDVARIHIDCLEVEEAGGKRVAVANTNLTYQLFIDLLKSHPEAAAAFPKLVKGLPGSAQPVQNTMDCSRAKTIFKWTPISIEKTVLDMTESLRQREKTWSA